MGPFGGFPARGLGFPVLGFVASLLWVLVVAAIVAGVVVLAVRLARQASHAPPASRPLATGDPAMEQLRLRYARGEISREDYLRMAADLGVPLPQPGRPEP
jgi:putative membrane protein